MIEERPRVKLQVSTLDRVLEWASWSAILSAWVYISLHYGTMPDTIPVHFSITGEANRYGGKSSLFLLPVILTIIIAAMTMLNRYPHIFNYTRRITAENALREYSRATRLLRIIKLVIAVFAFILTVQIIGAVVAPNTGLSWWVLPAFITSMTVPVIIFLIRWPARI